MNQALKASRCQMTDPLPGSDPAYEQLVERNEELAAANEALASENERQAAIIEQQKAAIRMARGI
ncbi:MAG: hypothetical protein CME72_11705 [Halomonadaceae bacterium]|nr:hypothetical protein [Halomonadaceae bacterium]